MLLSTQNTIPVFDAIHSHINNDLLHLLLSFSIMEINLNRNFHTWIKDVTLSAL